MAQSNNDSIIQQFLNTSTPVQETDPSAYDFIGQSDTAVTTPPPTEDTIARARLAFAKDTSKRNIDTAKTVLQAKKALGIDPRVAMHEQYMQGIDTRNEGPSTEEVFDLEEYKRLVRESESGGEVDPNTAQNPNSSATGAYQFTDGTWAGLMAKHPNAGLTADGRTNRAQQEIAEDLLASDDKDNLESKNIPVNYGNMYVMHTLGAGDGATILQAAVNGDTRQASEILPPQVVTSNPAWFQDNPTPQGLIDHLSGRVTSFTSGRIPPNDTPVEPKRSVGSTALDTLTTGSTATTGPQNLDANLDTVMANVPSPVEEIEGIKKSGDIIATKLGLKSDPDPVELFTDEKTYEKIFQIPEETKQEELSYEQIFAPKSDKANVKTFQDRLLESNVNPEFKRKVYELSKEPDFISHSKIKNIKGNVIEHDDGSFSTIINGKMISNFPSEAKATYYHARSNRDALMQLRGGYEEYSIGDITNYLYGSLAQPVEAGFRAALVGEQSLQGKVNEYNALKRSQPLLNDKATAISLTDINLYTSILGNKTLTPEQEEFKNNPKFAELVKLDAEAKENTEQAALIKNYGDQWRAKFPTNNAGFTGAQAVYDLIADKDGDFAAVWDVMKNHKAAYAKEGLGSAAYSLALVTGGLVTQSAILSAFIMDESQRAKADWITKNGAENYTPEVQSSIENWMALKVITQKISLGYLDKAVGAVPGIGRKAWIRKAAGKIASTTPASVKILGNLVGSTLGEAAQGGAEVIIEGQLPNAVIEWRKVYQSALLEGFGSTTLGPAFGAANVTTGIAKKILTPSEKEKLQLKFQKDKAAVEEQIKNIERIEKETNPKDLARLDELSTIVVDLETALAELPNTDIVASKNPVLKKLYEKHKGIIDEAAANNTNATFDDVVALIKLDLEADLNIAGEELDTLEKRLPKPAAKEPTLREKLTLGYVRDTFSGKTSDTSIKVGDTQYGQQLKKEIEQLEENIKKIENDSSIPETQAIPAIDNLQQKHNTLSAKLEETAKPSLLKAEKQYLITKKEKLEAQLEGDVANKSIEQILNTQINKDAGKPISDEDVAFVLDEIKVLADPTNPEYIALEDESEYGKGDIVDLKNDTNEENINSQGYIIEEVLGEQSDGKAHVRLKGLSDTVPIDQLINRVRPDENPRTILEKFQLLTQRNLSDTAKKLVQAEFDKFIERYAPKEEEKTGKTFGSIDDSQESIDRLSIEDTKKKLQAAKDNTDTLPEDIEFWNNEIDRKVEKAKRAKKEEQDDKSLANVHEEILEGESKKWKGLAKYHEEIINAYKNLTDPVLREKNIRSITSKMETHAGNLINKLAAFKQARGIPNLSSGMGAVVVGSIDESSPRGVRQMNYKVQTMPLTEADAKAEAKANGTEYKEGQSFESRKSNGQFVTLISDKAHKFENFTIKPSGGLIATLESEAAYGKLIMGTVRGYKNTSMSQKAANQGVKIEAKQKVYDQLVKLRGKLSRVVTEVTEEDRAKIKINKTEGKKQSLEVQLQEAEKKLKSTEEALNETEDTDETTKSTLQEEVDSLTTTIAGLKARIANESSADESSQDQDESESDDTAGKDQTSEKPPKFSDESAPPVRKGTESKKGKGEQLEFSFSGKNFIETATRVYHAVISAVSKENLDRALGLAGKKFTDLVSVGKKTTILGLQNLADTSFTNEAALAKSLEVLGVDNKAAKVLANRYFKFKTRFDKTLYHRVKEGGHVVLLDTSLDAEEKLKYAGVTFLIESIDGKNVTINNPNANNSKSLTVPLSEVMDVDNYAIRQPLSLLYREDNENTDNQQGTLPEQVIFSMMVGAMSWRQRTTDNSRFGDSDFHKEAFLYNNGQKLSPDENTELDKLGYGYNDVARQIGHEISKMLHLSPEKASGELTQEGIDIYFEHLIPALGMAAIETAQGNDTESYFIKDIHKWNFDEANVEGRVYNNNPEGSKEDKDGLGYRHLKIDEDRPPSEEGLAAVSDLVTALELDIQSTAGPLQNPRDIKTNVSGTFGDVPLEVQRLMKKLHKVEWSKSQPMDIVSDLFEDHHDVLKEIMGIEELYETSDNAPKNDNNEYIYVLDEEGKPKLDKAGEPVKKGKWHQYDMESKEASNRDKLASLKRLVEANDRTELEKFYFTYTLQNHHRIMQEGKINPQGSKVDRYLLKSWEPKTYNEKNLWKFELAVAQNFGSDIDKQTYGESQLYFSDLVGDKNVLAAVSAYQKLTKVRTLVESTKLKKANKTKHKNALAAKKEAAKEFADALSVVKSSALTKGGNMSLLQGIAGLSQYMKVFPSKSARLGFTRTINTSFESDIVMEIDGISNGFAMNVMQFPMWENMPEMLAKVATYFGDDTEHDLKAPDTYQTLAQYVQEAMGDGTLDLETNKISLDFINNNRWKDDYSELSVYKQNKWDYYVKKADKGNAAIEKKAAENLLSDYNRLNGALNTLYPDFTQDVNGLRGVVKYPFIIHMYGGGIDRISKDVTKDIIGEIYSRVGLIQRTYTDLKSSESEAAAFFQEYKFTEEGEQLEGEAKRTPQELQFIQEMRDFVNALDTLGAFKQDNKGSKSIVTKEGFIQALLKGESLDKYFNDKYLLANISTTIAPRFNHGLKTMLEPTQASRDTIIQMGGVLHGTFLAHFKRAYENKLAEVNKTEDSNRSTLTRKELTNLIKDTKGQLIKVFPQYKGPLSSIDENGNVEGFIDLSKTQNVSTLNEKVGVPAENIIKDGRKLTEFIEENADNLTEKAKVRLLKILEHKNDISDETKLDLTLLIEGRDKFGDERVEYRTAKQDENGDYDHSIPTTHNTFPQQLRFIEPGVTALIRQIINMDSVLLTQTMNGDPNITVDGKRWVGDPNVLMLHDAFMASPEQLSTISEAYGKLFLHYNRTHSVIEQTHEQVKKVLGITTDMDEAAPEGTPSLMEEIQTWVENEFFDNKNKDDTKKVTLDDLLKSFDSVTNTNSEFRRRLEELASENGGFNESLQMLMQKPGVNINDSMRDALLELAEDSANDRTRTRVSKTPMAEEFNRKFDEHAQTELFPDLTPEQTEELKNSLIAPKGKTYESTDLNDITGNTVKNLFSDFTKLSGDYYNNTQEENSHTDTLSRVLDILSEGFNATAGIQLTYEQIQGISQGAYSEAQERLTVSVSQQSPTIRNGQSPQEVYTHELLHGMTSIAIDQRPLIRNRIEKLYTQVENTLEKKYGKGRGYKVFLPTNTGPTNLATAEEIVMARQQYRHAFHAKEANRLHEFLAYANTNASLSNFMKTNPVAQRIGLFGRMLDIIKVVVDTIRETLGNKVYNAKDNTQFSEAIAITEHLVAIQNKHKSKRALLQSVGYKVLDAADQILRNFANNAERDLQKRVGRSGPAFAGAPLPLKIATGLAWLPLITLSEENNVQEYKNNIMDKMHYSLRGLAKEFGDGVLSKEMIEQLLQSKITISKARQLAETFQIDWFNGNRAHGITSIWKSLDPKKRHAMSVETREALTNVMLRTDISQLVTAGLDLDSPAGMKKIIDLIGKSTNAKDARELLQKDIRRRLLVEESSAAIQYADELGHFMMTGETERLADAYTNAYSIAVDHLANPVEERVALLDAYATISALGDIETKDAFLIQKLASAEFAADPSNNGMINIMQAHISYKAKSRRDLFEGDPIHMMKGYIVERMDNLTDIQIRTAADKEAMDDQGYTYSVPLGKIAADQTHTVMYINRNIAEVKDISGIMSTTNRRHQGTTLTEILSLNPDYQVGTTGKPNTQKIKAKVKQFKTHQNKLAKDLKFDKRFKFRPVRDPVTNKITDYRIMMNHKDVKEIIKPELEFQNVFAHMHSNLVDRKNTIKNDKETIHLLVHEQENLYKVHPKQFINLLDPESGYYERYLKLPRPIREYLQNFAVSGKFMVRLDIVDKVFGYKQLDVTQLKYFENNKHPFAKRIAGLAHYAIKETVGYGKNRVVLAVPKVILGNMMSNITQLMMRKIPLSYIISKTIEGISEYQRYSKDVIAKNKLQYEIDTKKLPSNSAEAQKVERLQTRIEGNRIHQMNEAGVDSLIIEDLNEAQLDGYWNRLSRLVFKGNLKQVGDKIPRSLQTVAHTIFWTKESLPYKYSKQVVQMTDFMGRYVMMEHGQNVLGQSFKQSLHESLEAFVLFDESLIAPLELLDSLGATAFLSYWLRNQRAVKKLIKANPATVALSAVVQEMTGIPTLGNVNSAWLGGDLMPNLAQTDDMFDEANNVTLFEAASQIKGMVN